jgi:FtsH-binding integral membrane protein
MILEQVHRQQIALAMTGMRIIAIAVTAFPVVLWIVLLILAQQAEPMQGMDIIIYIGAVMALANVPLSFVLKEQTLRKLHPNASIPEIVSAYRTGTIVALALCEGACTFAAITMYVTRLVVPAFAIFAAPFFAMLVHFPTEAKLETLINNIRR